MTVLQQTPARAWSTLILLFLLSTTAAVDKGALGLLIDPIKAQFGATDSQMGFLIGGAFVIVYATAGLVMATLADRWSRKGAIVIGTLLWSAMTLASAFAPTLSLLMLFRSGVGFGEAALIPSAISLIASTFSPQDRARACSIFFMGTYLGGAFSFPLGGAAVPIAASIGPGLDPFLGHLEPWRIVLLLAGVPGLVLGCAFWMMAREPESVHESAVALGSNWSDAFRFMASHRALFGFYFLGLLATAVYFSGHQTWFAIYLIRHFHEKPTFIGKVYFAFAFLSAFGTMIGPLVTAALLRRGIHDAPVLIACLAVATGAPMILLAALVPSASAALWLMVPACLLMACLGTMPQFLVLLVAPAQFRARITSVALLMYNGAGPTFGPLAVAQAALLYSGSASLGLGLATVGTILTPIGLAFYLLARKPFERAYAAVPEVEKENANLLKRHGQMA